MGVGRSTDNRITAHVRDHNSFRVDVRRGSTLCSAIYDVLTSDLLLPRMSLEAIKPKDWRMRTLHDDLAKQICIGTDDMLDNEHYEAFKNSSSASLT